VFTPPDVAARIDRAEGRLCTAIAEGAIRRAPHLRSEVFPLAGGVAVFAGPESPSNKMIGVGFAGVPAAADLDRVEQAFADRGATLQAEVSTLADPELHGALARRGYEPRGFENVLGHALTGLGAADAGAIAVERIDAATPEWIDVFVSSFAHPDSGGVGGDAIPPENTIRAWLTPTMSVTGFEGFAARLEGRIVGAAALRIDGDVAQFCGAGTLPGFRRRGVQTALLRARLRRAGAAGCAVAVVVTQPASKSQQNVQREGFALLYARQLLVKPVARP
jgi:ribosomal protein S18 acetylase RimI-like enzyme